MHPHMLLTTAELVTKERLARSAQRRLPGRTQRRRVTSVARLRAGMTAMATAARRRADSAGSDVEPATCVPSA